VKEQGKGVSLVGHRHVTWWHESCCMVAPSDANYQEQVIGRLAKCGTTDLSWTLHLFWARQRGPDVLKL
jgi:hypothetical protein